MADSLVCSRGAENHFDGHSDPKPAIGSSSSLVQRRIDFHPARKPFKGFSNGGGDFRLETLNPAAGSDQRVLGSEQGQSVSSVKKRDGSEFLENGLDPELSFGITFRRIGAGLQNLGNTCFLNSVLQCLTYTEPLAAYLQRSKHQTSCRIAGFCALCAIQKHVSIALKSTGGILVPNDLVKNLQCISRNFRKARQEDAHEYMVNLLESMHKCGLPSGVPSESPSAYEKSLVHKIFGGRLRSQVKCLQCSHCSNTFDPFLDLSLEIVKADSLQKALLNFTAAEQLDGGERQYQCQRCKQKVRALKQLTIHKAPYVLTVHLKRFHSHDPGQKIMKKVRFGPTLDLKSFVSGSYEGDLKYTLYGVLVHYGGSTRSGHYYCFVRTSNGIWHSLDDNRVAPVKEEKVFEQQAYMLFYVRDRRSTVPRKPLNDVVQKEHMKANAIGNRTSSTFNQGVKEAVQNGTVENRLNGATSATAVTKKEAPNVGQSMAPLMQEASVQKNNGLVVTEFSVPKKGPVSEPFSKAPLSKNPLEGLPVTKTNLVECLPLSAPSANGNGDAPNLEDVMVATAGGKITDCNENGSSKKYLSGATSPNFSDHPSSSTVKLVADETCRKNSHVSHVAPPGDLTSKKLNETDLGSSPEQPSCQKSQVECIPNVGNSLGEAGDRGQSFVLDESVKLSTIKTNGLHIEALGSKRQRKLKKKLLKCQVARMQLRSNFFLRASLSLRKKKKQKRSKSRILDVKNVSKEHLLDKDCVSSDMRPSTSESTRTTSLGLTHPLRKGTKSGSKKAVNSIAVKDVINSNGDCLMDDKIDGEFRVRINESSTVLATDKKLEKSSSSSSVPNQWEARQLDSTKDSNREVMQNGLMSMLTRGLEKTVVARWDGIELPPSEITESNGAESISIGYIPDEWDEEYDRGKRKKVRESKPVFGGPNPFQEIATKKPQMKKAKVDRYSSGNQPFRI